MTTTDHTFDILIPPAISTPPPTPLLLNGVTGAVTVARRNDPYQVSGSYSTTNGNANVKIGAQEFSNLCQLLSRGATTIRLTVDGTSAVCGFAAYPCVSPSQGNPVQAIALLMPPILQTLQSIETLLKRQLEGDSRSSHIDELDPKRKSATS